jgi:hypothetical protein
MCPEALVLLSGTFFLSLHKKVSHGLTVICCRCWRKLAVSTSTKFGIIMLTKYATFLKEAIFKYHRIRSADFAHHLINDFLLAGSAYSPEFLPLSETRNGAYQRDDFADKLQLGESGLVFTHLSLNQSFELIYHFTLNVPNCSTQIGICYCKGKCWDTPVFNSVSSLRDLTEEEVCLLQYQLNKAIEQRRADPLLYL